MDSQCMMNNCRTRCPDTEPFCAKHRDRPYKGIEAAMFRIEALQAEVARYREANGILEDALQEAGDDYPGSSMQEWCIQQVKSARQALKGADNAE